MDLIPFLNSFGILQLPRLILLGYCGQPKIQGITTKLLYSSSLDKKESTQHGLALVGYLRPGLFGSKISWGEGGGGGFKHPR